MGKPILEHHAQMIINDLTEDEISKLRLGNESGYGNRKAGALSTLMLRGGRRPAYPNAKQMGSALEQAARDLVNGGLVTTDDFDECSGARNFDSICRSCPRFINKKGPRCLLKDRSNIE